MTTSYLPAFHEFPDLWSLFCYKGLPAAPTCVQMQYPYHDYNPATYAVFFLLNVKVEWDRVACKSTVRLTMWAGLMRLVQAPLRCHKTGLVLLLKWWKQEVGRSLLSVLTLYYNQWRNIHVNRTRPANMILMKASVTSWPNGDPASGPLCQLENPHRLPSH